MFMADRILVMNAGRVIQDGRPLIFISARPTALLPSFSGL